jgi:hypothetical protein
MRKRLLAAFIWVCLIIALQVNYLFAVCPAIDCVRYEPGGTGRQAVPCPGCQGYDLTSLLVAGIPAWIIFGFEIVRKVAAAKG